MKVNVSFKEEKVLLTGANPTGPNPAMDLTNEQAKSLARAILVKLSPNELSRI
jgi:hypothetical protein